MRLIKVALYFKSSIMKSFIRTFFILACKILQLKDIFSSVPAIVSLLASSVLIQIFV
jgi:hypothetical protein